jgi:2-polyprenyl-3-methyl-5-hydroxy-6-metoxy-1,4-benzoquinol methylase
MRISSDPSTDWQRFGERDPYWAVLTDDKFRTAHINAGSRREFFESGELHVEQVITAIQEKLGGPFSPRRVLDFGCGVGRVLIPLARRFPGAVGLDVAESMLREARKNVEAAGVTADLRVSDRNLNGLPETFDLIHSCIVFQHIPPEDGFRLSAALLARLAPGGVAALHYTYSAPVHGAQRALRWARRRFSIVGRVANVLKGRPAPAPYMELYEYDLRALFEMFRRAGCTELHAKLTDHDGLLGALIFCRKGNLGSGGIN